MEDMKKQDKLSPAKLALLEMIRRSRARIDPQVLEIGRRALNGEVPYDRQAAADTIDLFLKNHKDANGFRSRLADLIRRQTH